MSKQEIWNLLISFQKKTSEATWNEAFQFYHYNKSRLTGIFMEGKDIVFEGRGKGTTVIKYRKD